MARGTMQGMAGAMAGKVVRAVERFWRRGNLRRWSRAARDAARMDPVVLRDLAGEARAVMPAMATLRRTAEERLDARGGTGLRLPAGTDWAWRPPIWSSALAEPAIVGSGARTAVGDALSLFHDCPRGETILRQIRNDPAGHPARLALQLEVFGFEGSFLSFALDLPVEAAAGLSRHHLVRLELALEQETPGEVFARLNIQHGPNVEKLVRELPSRDGRAMVEFDIAYARIDETRIERLWLDLIFEAPRMNRITLRDLTMCRLPRAPL